MAAPLSPPVGRRARYEWGSFTQRAFYRAIAWLVSRGKIVRVGVRMACVDGGYLRTAHGGAETEDDVEARRRIALIDDRRCFGCERKITGRRRRCRRCDREITRPLERARYHRRKAARAGGAA